MDRDFETGPGGSYSCFQLNMRARGGDLIRRTADTNISLLLRKVLATEGRFNRASIGASGFEPLGMLCRSTAMTVRGIRRENPIYRMTVQKATYEL